MAYFQRKYQGEVLNKFLQSSSIPRSLQLQPPSWIRAIRDALGMTTTQLANRMSVKQSSIAQLEKREAEGTASIANLRKAADALGCDLVYYLMPRIPLEQTIREQAMKTAARKLGYVSHSMQLEDQATSQSAKQLQVETMANDYIRTLSARIWDEP